MISWISSFCHRKNENVLEPLVEDNTQEGGDNKPSHCCNQSAIENSCHRLWLQCNTISSLVKQYFDQPFLKGLLAGASITVTAYSAYQLWFLNDTFTTKCLDALNGSPTELVACKAEFVQQITLYNGLVAGFCGTIGYLMQQYWENPPIPVENDKDSVTPPETIKHLVAHLQNNYSYELNIFLGYLYNGVWINTYTRSSWIDFFSCQSAAIGIASAFLGMYLRVKLLGAKILSYKRSQLPILSIDYPGNSLFKKHWSEWTIYGGAAVIFMLSWFKTPLSSSQDAIIICQEISLLIIARPFGEIVTNGIDSLNAKDDFFLKDTVVKSLSTILDFQAPLASLGYYVYLSSSNNIAKLGGMVIIGIALGIKDGRLEKIEESEKIVNEESEESHETKVSQDGCHCRTFIKSYWKTCVLLTFTFTSQFSDLLSCYSLNGDSSNTYSCPIGFDLSGNFVNIDGKGISFILTTAMIQYYARRLFKYIQLKKYRFEKITTQYISLTNRFQFDMISIIPYAIIKSGIYDAAFDAYASYNPYSVLTLLGVTLGTYKERIHSEFDPFRPAFSQLLI